MSLTNGFESQNWSTNTSSIGILEKEGDILYRKNDDDRLPIGSNQQILQVNNSIKGKLNYVTPDTITSQQTHNNLGGLQGGNATERYHLSLSEYNEVNTGVMTVSSLNEQATNQGILMESDILVKDEQIKINNPANALALSNGDSDHYVLRNTGTQLDIYRSVAFVAQRDIVPVSPALVVFRISSNGAISMPDSTQGSQNIQAEGGLQIFSRSSNSFDIFTTNSSSVDTERVEITSGVNTSTMFLKETNLTVNDGDITVLTGNVINNTAPTSGSHLTNKDYVDSLIQGLDWQDSVLDKDLSIPPLLPLPGDRYIVNPPGVGAWLGQDNNIAEWNGISWDFTIPNEGYAVWVEDEDILYVFNGSTWVKFSSTVQHNILLGLDGGGVDEFYHLNLSDFNNLTGGNPVFSSVTGGNIKISSNNIVSIDTNGNINITPDGTGKIFLKGFEWPNNDGSSRQSLQTNGMKVLSFNYPKIDVWIIRDVKSINTPGGTFTSGSWQTRTLNTLTGSSSTDITLSSNRITINAGNYQIVASAPGSNKINEHKLRFRNITDSTTTLIGSSESNNTSGLTTRAFLTGIINPSSTKTYELQHRCSSTITGDGFGIPSNFDEVEVYSIVTITRIG